MLDEVSIFFDLGIYALSWNKQGKDKEAKGQLSYSLRTVNSWIRFALAVLCPNKQNTNGIRSGRRFRIFSFLAALFTAAEEILVILFSVVFSLPS